MATPTPVFGPPPMKGSAGKFTFGTSRREDIGTKTSPAAIVEIQMDTGDLDCDAETLRQIAREGVFRQGRTGRGATHMAQAKKFWRVVGDAMVRDLVKNPLYGYEGRINGKPYDLSDTLRKPSAYSVIPWKKKGTAGRGVTVRAGTSDTGGGGVNRQRAKVSFFPEEGIAPGGKKGKTHPPRRWQLPIKYSHAKKVGPKFAVLYAESIQSELDWRRQNRRKTFSNI